MRAATWALAVGLAGEPALAQADPVTSEPRAFEPYSRTAQAITGPIILSHSRVVFATGDWLDLKLLDDAVEGAWERSSETTTAQLFEVSGEIGSLMNGNDICSDGPPRFLSVHQHEVFGSWSLRLAFFAGDTPTTGVSSEGFCGTFGYELDGPIGAAVMAAPEISATIPSVTEPENSGKWVVQQDINPIDDTKTVVAMLTADSGQSRMGDPVRFIARCQSNSTEAYVIWHDYVGDDGDSPYSDGKYVTVRIGDEPAREEFWGVSTDNEATFAPDWAGDLLKQMLRSDRMVLRMTPYSESPVTAVFDTTGLSVALRDLADTCNWSY